MREPEFLPPWYPLLLRRRRMVVAQAWFTGIVLLALATWGWIGQRQERAAIAKMAFVDKQLTQTGDDLHRLTEIEGVKAALEHQDQIVQRMGIHVPATRMISELEDLMPQRMALLELNMVTENIEQPQSGADKAAGLAPKTQRKLQMNLVGLTPTEDELATFLTKLVTVPYFTEVGLVKAEDHADSGHLMRKFEMKFALNLDPSVPQAVASGGGE
jgi:Tfp pilus assembly protein PilN